MYDIIIEDTTHQFEDQIRVIQNVYTKLKPGGILIIEDIFKRYNENDYIVALGDIMSHFQDYYFVSLDHANRNSTGWDNDKLFILVKNGEPLFKNENKLTIITPSYRTQNLQKLKESMDFNYINEWIIVYDETKIEPGFKMFDDPKIKEYTFKGPGISGNPQRNFALDNIENGNYLYFLDDDNIVHPDLFRFMNIIDSGKMYTFDQTDRLLGNNVTFGRIDTAMLLIDHSLCKELRWEPQIYGADGIYIVQCYNNNKNSHCYINNNLCYYNKLIV
jgi:hypothetical protein